MRFFDAHCDTIRRVVQQDLDITADHGLHVTLPGMLRAGMSAQVFAVWVVAAGAKGREDEMAMELVMAAARLCRQHPQHLAPVHNGTDLVEAQREGRVAVILALEGGDPLKGKPLALHAFYQQGVRLLTLCWLDNPFSGATYGSGSGLTAKGGELIELCEELGVLVDVSHASDKAFFDVCKVASRPFVASHSNCRAICSNPRNLSDNMIRKLGEKGGVLGINLGSGFLSPDLFAREKGTLDEFLRRVKAGDPRPEEALQAGTDAASARPPIDWVAKHVKHALRIGGEACVGLGGDLDGVDSTPEGLDGIQDYPKIAELLESSGLTPDQVDKVCYENFARVFREVVK